MYKSDGMPNLGRGLLGDAPGEVLLNPQLGGSSGAPSYPQIPNFGAPPPSLYPQSTARGLLGDSPADFFASQFSQTAQSLAQGLTPGFPGQSLAQTLQSQFSLPPPKLSQFIPKSEPVHAKVKSQPVKTPPKPKENKKPREGSKVLFTINYMGIFKSKVRFTM